MYSAIHDFPHIAACRLSNDFIRPRQHIRRNRQADLLRRLEVDDQLELCRLLDWQVRGFCAFQDPVNVGGGTPEPLEGVRSITYAATSVDKFPVRIQRWQAALGRKLYDLCSVRPDDRAP